jgi:hypothetical protein
MMDSGLKIHGLGRANKFGEMVVCTRASGNIIMLTGRVD